MCGVWIVQIVQIQGENFMVSCLNQTMVEKSQYI